MIDERQGKPSASYIEQMRLCPGSWRAQQGLPNQESDDSKAGDLIHAALADDVRALEAMNSDQHAVYEELRGKVEEMLEFIGFEPNETKLAHELRVWNATGEFSGKADRLYVCGLAAFVPDFKTGRNEVEEPSSNLQLRALAVLAAHQTKAEIVYVSVIQIGHKPRVCMYDISALRRAELEVLSIIHEAEKDDAKRIPGDKQCRYCKAVTVCPEYRNQGSNAVVMVRNAPALQSIPSDLFPAFLDSCDIAERWIKNIRTEAKRRIAAGEQVPGYVLKTGSPREKIINLPVIHARAEKLGITTERFTEACSLTKKAAKAMIQEVCGVKGSSLDNHLNHLIDGCTEPGEPPEPSLEKISQPLNEKAA